MIKNSDQRKVFDELMCCPMRIRTSTDRTKTCSATITPWDKDRKETPSSEISAKIELFFDLYKSCPLLPFTQGPIWQ